ncbi:MAG: hypothetical protein GKR83_07670 [Synechococcus sp. s2_metabat2_7]|nr:hypothetical protein [Synechococcus sp. s2_metabat2_7]
MANWVFTTDYLEEQTNFDLDGNGVIGDGTDNNSAAPVGLKAGYADGDNYVAAVNLGSVAALNAVKAFFNKYNSDNSIVWGGSSSFKYNAIEGSAAEINGISNIDLGNIAETIFVNNGISALADVSTLEEIKSKNPGANLIYYGAKGTTKSLADSRSGGFDWIEKITPFAGKKYVTLTDLGVNPDHFKTLTNGLDKDDYIFDIGGLTYGVNGDSFIGQIEGPSLVYRSDLIPDSTTSFTEGADPNVSGAYTVTAIGFSNKIPQGDDIVFSDYNIAGDDISNQAKFKVHFYGGEQLSHVNISGATVSTNAGYKYSQTAGSGTTTVADDIWTLELKLDAGQPAKTTSVSDNTGAEIIGVMFNSVSAEDVGGSNDYGGSVFRTNGFYLDIDLMSSDYKFSDLSPGFAIDGTNGEEVDFDFYFTKNYLERTFAVDFDAIDGGFAGTGLTNVDENNDHLGSYIDVSKPGSLSELRLPVTITDVSGTTAGGLTDLYEVDFKNSSWSQANLSMVYGPSVNDAPTPTPTPTFTPIPTPLITPTPIGNLLEDGIVQYFDVAEVLTNQEDINIRMMGGNDYLEVIGGSDNFANGNMGQDTIILRGGIGEYLGGKDGDTIKVFNAEEGTSVNGNRGEDYITGFVAGVSYRGGKDKDILEVSQGEVWGDKAADTFRGVSGEGYAVIQDYSIGEDLVEIDMEGIWSTIESGLIFTDNSGDKIMLLVGINDIAQVSFI